MLIYVHLFEASHRCIFCKLWVGLCSMLCHSWMDLGGAVSAPEVYLAGKSFASVEAPKPPTPENATFNPNMAVAVLPGRLTISTTCPYHSAVWPVGSRLQPMRFVPLAQDSRRSTLTVDAPLARKPR